MDLPQTDSAPWLARLLLTWKRQLDATEAAVIDMPDKAEQRSVARQAQYRRVRSALSQKVNVIEGVKAGFHAG